jgi:fructan beta-fructosidase
MTVPRSLTLRETGAGRRLVQRPVQELERLRGQSAAVELKSVRGTADLSALSARTAGPFELEAEFGPAADTTFELAVQSGEAEATVVRFDGLTRRLTLDRTKSGAVGFHRKFPGAAAAPARLIDGRLRLRLWVDTSSIEVFADDGEAVLTALVFPTPGGRRLGLTVTKGELPGASLRVWDLASAWTADRRSSDGGRPTP